MAVPGFQFCLPLAPCPEPCCVFSWSNAYGGACALPGRRHPLRSAGGIPADRQAVDSSLRRFTAAIAGDYRIRRQHDRIRGRLCARWPGRPRTKPDESCAAPLSGGIFQATIMPWWGGAGAGHRVYITLGGTQAAPSSRPAHESDLSIDDGRRRALAGFTHAEVSLLPEFPTIAEPDAGGLVFRRQHCLRQRRGLWLAGLVIGLRTWSALHLRRHQVPFYSAGGRCHRSLLPGQPLSFAPDGWWRFSPPAAKTAQSPPA